MTEVTETGDIQPDENGSSRRHCRNHATTAIWRIAVNICMLYNCLEWYK